MTLFLGSLQLGLIYGLLAIGVFIAFRILNIPDLTAEGSFTFGLAVSAKFTLMGHPFLGIIAAVGAGALAGSITGLFQTKLLIHPVLAGILTMSGLYTINLLIMGSSSNLSLIGSNTIFKIMTDASGIFSREGVKIILPLIVVTITALAGSFFFKTRIGLCIRATGNNEDMVRASSIDVDVTKIIALAAANASIALSGALISQYQGFADINSGVGIIVVGLASVIIGELIFRKDGITYGLFSAILGSILYRFMIALALKYSPFPAYALKLVSACIVAIALSIPAMKYRAELEKIKKGARKSC
ncbi:ABC transporter permease [Lacrimispora sp.]|uniref:ABC transporter permease n=1 Tax=Lacrimispora sp. TaxID=2719234 RepID=UPI00399650BB